VRRIVACNALSFPRIFITTMGYDSGISRRSLLTGLSLLPAAWLLRGQQDPQQDSPPGKQDTARFSTGVKVVNLFATVRNKKGEIVRDLAKDEFVLDEDGRPQEIRYFSQESNLPLTLGLLVDTSGSQRRVLNDERSASFRFLEQVLREDKDLAFIIHFDFEVELLQDLTSSRAKLERALDLLQVGSPQQQQQQQGGQYPNGGGYPGGGGGGGGGNVGIGLPGGIGFPGGRRRGGGQQPYPRGGQQGRRGGGTCLYDAVVLAADDLMRKQQGRKALILLTDGVDTGSKLTLSQAVESAQRADTLVYSILFSDASAYGNTGGFGGMSRRGGYPGGGGMNLPDGKRVLEQISRETGGRFFEVSKKQPIEKVYSAIEEDLRNQYSLGYTPDRQEEEREYHRIHLVTKRKELVVQTREGYYPT
jgi:VWFA-related protein